MENTCKGKKLMWIFSEHSQTCIVRLLTSQKLRAQVTWLESEPAPLKVEIQYLVKLSTSPHAMQIFLFPGHSPTYFSMGLMTYPLNTKEMLDKESLSRRMINLAKCSQSFAMKTFHLCHSKLCKRWIRVVFAYAKKKIHFIMVRYCFQHVFHIRYKKSQMKSKKKCWPDLL